MRDYLFYGNSVYLELQHIEGFENDSTFFQDFDITPRDLVLKIENANATDNVSIIFGFNQYIQELSPATLSFNNKNFLEIDVHSGTDGEEGWSSSFGEFNYTNYEIYAKNTDGLTSINHQNSSGFATCKNILEQIQNVGIPTYMNPLSDLNFNRLKRMLKLCVKEGLEESIQLLKSYYFYHFELEYEEVRILTIQFIDTANRVINTHNIN